MIGHDLKSLRLYRGNSQFGHTDLYMAGFKNDLRVFLPKITTNLVHQEWVTNKTFHSRLPKMFL